MISHALLFGALSASAAYGALYDNTSVANRTCGNKPITSCSLQALDVGNVDTCCTETFGGLLASTQFWDTYTGREDAGQLLPQGQWTLHGLWPDFCNGSFTQYCDAGRQYDPRPSPAKVNGHKVPPYKGPSVDTMLEDYGATDLLDWMEKNWVAQNQPSAEFWAHEFSKHATCYSTFDVACYGKHYRKHEDLVQFYETAIKYFNSLPTFKWLQEAGITPSNTTTYSLSDISGALADAYGKTPYLGCSGSAYNETEAGKNSMDNGRTVLNEVWYFSHANGRPQEHNIEKMDSVTKTSCAKSLGAIHYYERANNSVREM